MRSFLIATILTNGFSGFEEEIFSEKISKPVEYIEQQATREVIYFGVGTIFAITGGFARLGWGASQITPFKQIGKECLLFSDLCFLVSQKAFHQIFKTPFFQPQCLKTIPSSQYSWYQNKKELSEIPAFTKEQKELLLFLENRWLAKSTGIFSSMVDFVCPCFDIFLQVHPDTDGSYARSPQIGFSKSYKKSVDRWKEHLPHPKNFPLILTRPTSLEEYFPLYIKASKEESLSKTLEKASSNIGNTTVLDLSELIDSDLEDWNCFWNQYEALLSKACIEKEMAASQILCMQKIENRFMGGIRLLPISHLTEKEIEEQHRFFIERISTFGLSANRVELDRSVLFDPSLKSSPQKTFLKKEELTDFFHFLDSFKQEWKALYPEKTLMVEGALKILKGLFTDLPEESWSEVANCPTKSALLKLSCLKMQKKLENILKTEETQTFFEMVTDLEEVHASLASCIEIFSFYTKEDFSDIYRNLLSTIPETLKPMTYCGIHSSGMTNLAGILKSTQKMTGQPLHIVYGENIYYECVNAANLLGKTTFIEEAKENDLANADLLLVQFNPALKRIDLPPTLYKTEEISKMVQAIFNTQRSKPLTLALDSTFDFINSKQLALLLQEFEAEIQKGLLNIICYRSGLKFDLFGMDNYCGAPFFMIHNNEPKWLYFRDLLDDPALQTDSLSLNWFCLAYKNAAQELELYRKQIFKNTRALLEKIPKKLFDDGSYRVIPVREDVDIAFIDIKVSGPLHQSRAAALVGGTLYLDCLLKKQPIFYRITIGLYHPNYTMIFADNQSTVRLTLGLDPQQVDVLADCFKKIDALNEE